MDVAITYYYIKPLGFSYVCPILLCMEMPIT
jgi:hypothetical protein